MTSPTLPAEPAYADRTYRSSAGIAGGALLLALSLWLGVDTVVQGHGRAPWLALAGLLCAVPLITAFSFRPVVLANDDRLLVRNPFRTITLPWAAVADVRAGYSSEVFDQSGGKYQLWAIPVSLRQRKRASAPSGTGCRGRREPQLLGDGGRHRPKARLSPADQSIRELRDLAEQGVSREGAQGGTSVRWAYESSHRRSPGRSCSSSCSPSADRSGSPATRIPPARDGVRHGGPGHTRSMYAPSHADDRAAAPSPRTATGRRARARASATGSSSGKPGPGSGPAGSRRRRCRARRAATRR